MVQDQTRTWTMRGDTVAALSAIAAACVVVTPPALGQMVETLEQPTFRQEPIPQRLQEVGGSDFYLPTFFLEAGVSVLDVSVSGSEAGFARRSGAADERTGGTLRGGLAFNDFFALEIDASFFDSETTLVVPSQDGRGGFEVAGDTDELTATYGRVSYFLGENLSVHGRLGYARLDTEVVSAGVDDDTGVAFGAGARYGFWADGAAGLRFDYTRLALQDVEADIATLAISFRY